MHECEDRNLITGVSVDEPKVTDDQFSDGLLLNSGTTLPSCG